MKVVVLGFDGMDPNVVSEMWGRGELPALRGLADEGLYSDLESTVIPMSPAAWSSFLTGTNPGKHGIYDFVTRTGPESETFEVVDSTSRRAPAVWDYLNDRGRDAGVAGVPITYPVDSLDGYMVSGFPTPSAANSVTPDALRDRSPVDPTELHPEVLYTGSNRERFVRDQFRCWEAMAEFHEFALADAPCDLHVTVFKQTDDIAHVAWGDDPLYEAYRRADRVVAETLQSLRADGEEFLLLVLSDHGFGPVDKTLFLNNVLLDLGYADLRPSIGTRVRTALWRGGVNLRNAYRLLDRLGLAESVLDMSYGGGWLGRALEGLRDRLFLGPNDLDPETSDAFSRGNFGQLFLRNDVGDALETALREYEVDGESIVEEVYRASEEFHGPAADLAPDLMVETPDYRYVTSRGFALATDAVLTDHVLQRAADHKPTGVLFAAGTPVSDEASLDATPTLEDLLPTMLAALDEPVPTYSDGDVLVPLVPGDEWTTASYDLDRGEPERDGDDGVSEDVEDRLRSLGYTS